MTLPLKHPVFPKWLAGLLALSVVAVLLGSYTFLRAQTLQDQAEAEAQLTAIARLKTEMIANWRAERLADARSFSGSPSFAAIVANWMKAPQPEISADFVSRFQALQPLHQYRDIALVDTAGQPRLSLGGVLEPLDAAQLSALSQAFDQGQPVFCDLHRNPAGTITLDVIAPLLSQPEARPVGAIVLKIDPEYVLYPLLQTWPVPSVSAESLLVRREGDDVVWLNNLRYQTAAALSLRMPLVDRNVPAVMAALGQQGVFKGVDYRGVPVYSALASVPNSPWFLVAKEDTAEVLAPLRLTTGLVLALMLGLLAGTIGLTWSVWQQTQKQYYRAVSAAEAAQLALTRRVEYLLKYANDIILLADGDFRLVEVNDRALEAYGYPREEMLKLTMADLVAPEDADTYQQHQRELQEKGSYVREARHRRWDGSAFPAEVSARVIDIEGRHYYQAIFRDITDRKRAAQVIQRQNEQLHVQNEELTAQREELQAQNEELSAQQEELLQARDGLEVRVRKRTDELEQANAVLEEQIEERRQAEERVRQNAQRMGVLAEVSQTLVAAGPDFRAALDQLVRAIALFIGDACLIRLLSLDNQRLDLAAFYHADPGRHKVALAVLAAEAQSVAEGIAGRAFRTKQTVFMPALSTEDLRRQVRPGRRPYLERARVAGLIVVPIMIQAEVFGILAIYRLTAECLYTAEDLKLLQSLADRLALAIANARLYRDLENALAQEKAMRQQLILSEKLSAMGRVIGSVAHELNNPLQTITNCLYLTKGDLPAESPIHQYLEMASSETQRLTHLVAQLREVYRPRLTGQAARLNLLQLLADVQRLLAPQLERQCVQWQLASPLAEVPVSGTADQLKQVFINLGQNATEAMQPGGGRLSVEVVFATDADGRQVGVAFRDTGPGIAPKNLDRLFEPFYTTKPTGLGLGLSICNDIIQRHGGRIAVESQPGQGAVFTVWLPLDREAEL